MPQTYFRQIYITSNYSHHIETEQDEPQFIIAALILLYVSTVLVLVDGYVALNGYVALFG